jgi:sulfinoalanine decarboxylase
VGSDESLADDPVRSLERVREILLELFEEEIREPCLPHRSPQQLSAALDLSIPDRGKTDEELFALAREMVLSTPRTATRTFFNLLFAGRVTPALAGEMLAAALNNSLHTYKAAGPQILIEQVLIEELCRQTGFPSGEGILTPGGSLSNLVAMAVARNEALPDLRDDGRWTARLTAYTSDQGHYSIVKNAGILGIGRSLVRRVTSDPVGRLRPDQLEQRIEQDLGKGLQPFLVNATAGTTVLGAFDSVSGCTSMPLSAEARC